MYLVRVKSNHGDTNHARLPVELNQKIGLPSWLDGNRKMTAAVNSTSAASKVDSTRERELFRYYQPSESTIEKIRHKTTLSVDAATSPDTTLTALAQLCALRLHASRAMIR